jgi:glycosyltransferase involved in cell wall biosynthesis
MIFDTMTIVISSILLLIAIVSSHCNVFLRRFRQTEPSSDDSDLPKLSIVITAHNHSQELSSNLSAVLSQSYPSDFEVIVVNAASNDDTEDVLKRYKALNKNLYTTFTPDSSRYMSRKKLAITLGVKAAKNEWIILIEPYCRPESDKWLESIGRRCKDSIDLVIGYSNYKSDKEKHDNFSVFKRLVNEYYSMREAVKGIAFEANSHNIAFRQSLFMKNDGFLSNLKFLRGEYDFIVNDIASKGRTAVITEAEGRIIEDLPSNKDLQNENLFNMETHKHLKRRIKHKLLNCIDTLMLILNYLVQICAIIVSVDKSLLVITIAASLSLLITMLLRIIYAHHILKEFEPQIGIMKVIPYEISRVFSSLRYRLRYAMTDKMNFIRR